MSHKQPEVTLDSLYKIFTVPESEDSTLSLIEKEISQNLRGFLKEHIVSSDTLPVNLEKEFSDYQVPEQPMFVSDQAEFLLDKVVSQAVHTASPRFVGHMTSALPYFLLPISKMMIALNQNLVKIETSKSFTPLERQVIGMLHHLIYQMPKSFYKKNLQNHEVALGAFCSNGTVANITALWVAVNRLLPKTKDFDGVGDEGIFAGLNYYDYRNIVFLVSSRGHYSLQKAANLLGVGKKNLISIPTDDNNRIDLIQLKGKIAELKQQNIGIAAVIGIAGTTETGNVDPLKEMAEICRSNGLYFHVDAAWGGPTLFSSNYKHLVEGIEQADSVTIDAHKQLYIPMGAGFAIFKDKTSLGHIEHHAEYIIRKGSRDLGRKTLEGSRPGMAMLVQSGFKIIGRKGYELLIDMGIEKARVFASMIDQAGDFELISQPELNILTYRFVPEDIQLQLDKLCKTEQDRINQHLNRLTITIQKEQRDKGRTFVSRTALKPKKYNGLTINVFRVVLANPLTQKKHLTEILEEQRKIAKSLLNAQLTWTKTGSD